jgi:hypothetical protein
MIVRLFHAKPPIKSPNYSSACIAAFQPIPRTQAQRFIRQVVVAMFAEDIDLLPAGTVQSIVNDCLEYNQSPFDLFGSLFRQMNSPKPAPAGRFKGGLLLLLPDIVDQRVKVDGVLGEGLVRFRNFFQLLSFRASTRPPSLAIGLTASLKERRDARKGRFHGEPRLDAHNPVYDRRRDEMSLDDAEKVMI